VPEETVALAPASDPAPSATDIAVAAALADAGLKPEPAVLKIEAAAHVPVMTPRPVLRPARLQTVALEAPTLVSGEADPAAIAAGTRLVQLGAFASADVARSEWADVETRFSDYFVGKTRVIQEVESGGREFYRLRVMGFEDLADARRFCAVIVADGTNCIPVVHQ
jgi:cell division septation protein DedD